MTTTYRTLTIEDVLTVLKNANLNPHVVSIALTDPTLAVITLHPVEWNGKRVANEAGSVRDRLLKQGVALVLFSAKERRAEFRIPERKS